MTFSDKIKKIRLDNNLTQQQFADKLSISRSVVAKWEQDRGMPSLDLLKKISKTFDVSVEYLLGENNLDQSLSKSDKPVVKKKIEKRHFLIPICIVVVMVLLSIFVVPPIVWYSCGSSYMTNYQFYGEVTVLDESIEIKGNKDTLTLKKSIVKKLDIFDMENNPTTIDAIKTGNRVRVFGSKHEKYISEKEYIEYETIEILDDYCIDETGLKGFFISTTEYTGDKPPINSPEDGYVDSENLNLGMETKYPYVIYRPKYMGSVSVGPIQFNDETYSLTAYAFDEIYIYILDDSENGYSLYSKLSRYNLSVTLPEIILFSSLGETDYTKKYSYRYTRTIELNTVYSSGRNIRIDEYDKNNNVIESKIIFSYAELSALPSKYMLNDATRYFRINHSDPHVAGEQIEIFIEVNSGLMWGRQLAFY